MLPSEPVLSLIDLEKRYAPRRGHIVEVFDDEEDEADAAEAPARTRGGWTLFPISAVFFPGERIALIGGHDAGKTTLLRLVAGTLLPNAGIVSGARACLLNDYLAPFNADAAVCDNLALIARLQGVAPETVLDRMDEIERLTEAVVRLQTPAGAIPKADYGKIATAAALLTEPTIILADNSLGSGDPDFRERLKDQVMAMTDAGAILIVAPRKTTQAKALCRRGLWLDNGRLMVDGPVADAIKSYLESDDETVELEDEVEEPVGQSRKRPQAAPANVAPHVAPALVHAEQSRFGDVVRFEAVDASGAAHTEFASTDVAFQFDLEAWIGNQTVDVMIELLDGNASIAMLYPTEPYRFTNPGRLTLRVQAPRELMTNRAHTARIKATFLDADLNPTEMVYHLISFEIRGDADQRLARFHRHWPPKRPPLTTYRGVWEIASTDGGVRPA